MNDKKNVVVAILATACLMSTLFALRANGTYWPYDPWWDLNDDGKIDVKDIARVSAAFGTSGQNITKAGLEYDSGWINITDKNGQNIIVNHNLNITDWNDDTVGVEIQGKPTDNSSLNRYPGLLVGKPWNKTYGCVDYDEAWSVVQTTDEGYVMAGMTNSLGAGGYDGLVVRTDLLGRTLWNKTYGGLENDCVTSIIQTSSGDLILSGWYASYGTHGSHDAWLIKTDIAGNVLWSRTYGWLSYDQAWSAIETLDGGYALAGFSNSFSNGYDFYIVKTDASGNMQWNKTYGGSSNEEAFSIIQTDDGGFALAGYTYSYGCGASDLWLVRTDTNGLLLWDKTYGGAGCDSATSMVQANDGGFVFAGFTDSFGAGGRDCWLLKTDAGGDVMFNKTYGGLGDEQATSVIQTHGWCYALGGYTNSTGNGSLDFWLVKTDSDGNMLESSSFGGADQDGAHCLIQTTDGGYALAGYTYSSGAGNRDYWMVKTWAINERVTMETWGGIHYDWAYSIVETSDEGFALAGATYSYSGDPGTHCDAYLIKTDRSGGLQWSRSYGGAYNDYFLSIVQTSDGGYALVGYIDVWGTGNNDCWLVKTDEDGIYQWNKTFGGTGEDSGHKIIQTGDGGYAIAGNTAVWTPYESVPDFWLIKTDASGNAQWNKTYNWGTDDYCSSLVQTSDGGYALAGTSWTSTINWEGSYDYSFVKTDALGNQMWRNVYGTMDNDNAYAMIQTLDGGFALAGNAGELEGADACIVKINKNGDAEWTKFIGGHAGDMALSIIQTCDCGYVFAGATESFGVGRHWPFGYLATYDAWIVKTDAKGDLEWLRTYGEICNDFAREVVQTADGRIAFAGYTGDILFHPPSEILGNADCWLVTVDFRTYESGLAWVESSPSTITVYRGTTDVNWNYVRVRVWKAKKP